jgi:Zn-dependent peptidase ImmA (M78 family)
MDRIIATLQLPAVFFLRKPERESGVVFWRSLANSTKLAQMVGECRLGWVQDITTTLEEHLELPPINLPEFNIPRDPLAIGDELIERLAAETRKFWGLGDGPIENVTGLLERNGIVLARDDLRAPALDALSKWCPENHSAFCLVSSGKESTARSRLSVLHELGHLVLHRGLDRWHLENKKLHQLIEAQAFRFGGAFALPAESFASDVYSLSLDAFVNLKYKWKFAIGMMLKRCESLGIGKEETHERLWRSLSSRGWRLSEPLDDEIPSEHPTLLADGIRFILDQKVLTAEQFCYTCALAPRDVEELADLGPGTIDPTLRTNVAMLPTQEPGAVPPITGKRATLFSFPSR